MIQEPRTNPIELEMRDVTGDHRDKEALRESAMRLHDIAASIPGAVYQLLIKPDGGILWKGLLLDITEGKFQEEAQDLTGRLNSLVDTPGGLRELMSRLTAFLQDWSGCEAVGIRLRNGDDQKASG